jgi:DNA-binding NtrC family response regulator
MPGPRVMVVDDEDDFRETLVNRLRKREIDATEAENGQKALDLLENYLFDVIILDIRMPGLDGIAVLREIKKIKPLIEVILLTGHATVESGIEGMRLGAFDYLVKPADFDALLEKIEQAFAKKSVHDDKIQQAIIRDLKAHPAHILEQVKEERRKKP